MSFPSSRRAFLQTAGCAAAAACVGDCLVAEELPPDKPPMPQLTQWLKQPILEPRSTMLQVQDYTEPKVVEMPPLGQREQWEQMAERLRCEVLDRVVFRGVPHQWRHGEMKVQWLDTIPGGPGYRIRKVRYEALPNYWIPGLLYEPLQISGRVPLVYRTHGHVGSGGGKAKKNVQVHCINMAKRGLLAFTADWPDIGQLSVPGRHYRMHQLDLCGVSGLAPFYLCLSRALDFLLELPQVDPERVAVTGISGGGWQTIFISALDTRVKLANPVAGYSSFRTRARHISDLGDGEQAPPDMATIADYTHLTALVAPRPLLLTYNAQDDCCFRTAHALPPLLEAARPVYELYGKVDHLRWHNDLEPEPGARGHNYGAENREAFYAMLGDFFFPGNEDFPRKDLAYDEEIKTYDELLVPLPEPNHGFNSMAREAMVNLPRTSEVPGEPESLKAWQAKRRPLLAEIVRAKRFNASAEQIDSRQDGPWTGVSWQLHLGNDWTVGGVELCGETVKGSSVLIADDGRRAAARQTSRLLEQGRRVLAVDPFNFGESQIRRRGALFCLHLATVGDRPLGLAASQLAAIARWLHRDRQSGPVELVAVGPRTGVVATVAAALEEEAIGSLRLHHPSTSLKELIRQDRLLTQMGEQFCFGLLEAFDLSQLQALVTPRPIVIER